MCIPQRQSRVDHEPVISHLPFYPPGLGTQGVLHKFTKDARFCFVLFFGVCVCVFQMVAWSVCINPNWRWIYLVHLLSSNEDWHFAFRLRPQELNDLSTAMIRIHWTSMCHIRCLAQEYSGEYGTAPTSVGSIPSDGIWKKEDFYSPKRSALHGVWFWGLE